MKYFKLFITNILLLSSLAIIAQGPPIHSYELNNSYADDYGGNDMVPNGGSLTSTAYVFDAGQGPNVSNVIDPNHYSIEMRFTPTYTDYWRKILDFKNNTSDHGLYIVGGIEGGFLFFYPIGYPPIVLFSPNVPVTIILSRDGITKQVRIYVDGIERFSFIDDNDLATFTGPGNIIQILLDDNNGQEQSPGSLDYFRIYDYVIDICGYVDSDCDGVNDDCDVCPGGNDNGPCNVTELIPLNEIPIDWLCSNNSNSEKILICHEGTTLCVSENAANTHLAHGDFLGPCISCTQNLVTSGSSNNLVNAAVLELIHSEPQEEHDITRERMKLSHIQVFPNPATSEIHFVIPKVHQEGTLRILSLTGHEMYSLPLTSQQSITLDISTYASGLYIADVESISGHYQTKFVKL